MASVIALSACDGRGYQYANFESQQAICASKAAALAKARMRADSASPILCATIRLSAMRLSAPAVNVPLDVFHLVAVAICAAVRVSEICFTSVRAARNCEEPTRGGAGARSWLGDVRKKERVPWSDRTTGDADDTHLSAPTGGAPGTSTR